ncbi:hypothetical protein V6N13_106107 [Hibiscus sabdariffa]|uniref:Uncharacterized protein n=1 Tax=Hibiscus sabdariffa TaxID=183260 RepID=A0ABR2EZR1_9ROSI
MPRRYAPSLPSPSLRRSVLNKQRSWSPDAERDEAWLRRKELYGRGLRRTQSFTADDIEELKGCIDLGFGFEPDSPELDPKLSQTLPALEFYCAINRQFNGGMSRSMSASSMDSLSDAGSTTSIIDQGDDPEMVKTRLRQWAQVVACSVSNIPWAVGKRSTTFPVPRETDDEIYSRSSKLLSCKLARNTEHHPLGICTSGKSS